MHNTVAVHCDPWHHACFVHDRATVVRLTPHHLRAHCHSDPSRARTLLQSSMVNEFRFALRALRRRPSFAAAVILTLALGIGTSSGVLSLVEAALIRPLPFKDPTRLAMLWGVVGPQRTQRGASYAEIADWRSLNHSFTDVAAYDEISLNLATTGEPRRVEA